jgi:hypothetical protein
MSVGGASDAHSLLSGVSCSKSKMRHQQREAKALRGRYAAQSFEDGGIADRSAHAIDEEAAWQGNGALPSL